MSPAAGRGRRRSAAKHEAITRAARSTFMARGFHGATMDDIALAAGASKATVYNHFADKAELFRTVILSEIERLHASYASSGWDSGKPGSALRRFGASLLHFLVSEESRQLSRVTIAMIDRFPELGDEFYERGIEHTQAMLASFIRSCDKAGTLRCDRPADAAAQLLGELIGLPQLRSLLGVSSLLSAARLSRHVNAVVTHFMALYAPRSQ